MKEYFKKAVAILGSALMISSSAALAVAANYPSPFSEGAAIVVGANAALSDGIAANTISTGLGSKSTDTGVSVVGTAWQVGTSSDKLEIGESLYDVDTYVDKAALSLLGSGSISNSKGTATYEQYLYFEDTYSSMVNYTENDDKDEVADFFHIANARVIARYVIDFTTNLESDITSAGVLDDIENKELLMLGKTYIITAATNDSDGDVTLKLLSGANKATIESGQEISIGGYTISALVSSSTVVKFTINGVTLSNMNKGDIEPIVGTSDYIAVSDITYESFSGGLHKATFWVGADQIEFINNTDTKINGESVPAKVQITRSEASGDISISEISVNMTADDDYYLSIGGKLSQAIKAEGDKPEVLITKNWDIEFKGYAEEKTDTIKLKSTGSDKDFDLTFTNYLGNNITLPLFYTNNTGIFPGDTSDKTLVFMCNESGTNITKNDYFILNTGNAAAAGNNVKTFVVQYKGSDKRTDTTPKAKFDVLGVVSNTESSIDTALGSVRGTRFDLKLGGSTFNFMNTSTTESDNFQIALVGTATSCGSVGAANNTLNSLYLRTRNNAFINITDTNWSIESIAPGAAVDSANSSWIVNVTIDDTSRDNDDLTLPETVLYVTYNNGTNADVGTTVTKLPASSWKDDPSNSDRETYRTRYGVLIDEMDGSDAPADHTLTVPENILNPLVYISSGDISVSTGTTSVGTAVVIYDNEVSSMADKQLIVVGGSCINKIAAKLLTGSEASVCTSAFTTLTTIAAGQALIQVFDAANAGGTAGKTALLVAGYNAEDTTKGVTYLTNNAVDTTVGTKLKVTSTTQATAIAE